MNTKIRNSSQFSKIAFIVYLITFINIIMFSLPKQIYWEADGHKITYIFFQNGSELE